MNRKAEFDCTDRRCATGQVQQLLRVEALAMFAAITTLFFVFGGELSATPTSGRLASLPEATAKSAQQGEV